ncbi:MAG: AAA family ATPase [Byssovorax sp.]
MVLLGPNGVGKTMLLRNLAHRALHAGHAVVVRSASDLLADLIKRSPPRRGPGGSPPTCARTCSASTRWDTCPTTLATPTCSSRSSPTPLRRSVHSAHHQPALRRVADDLPQRLVRGHPGRSAHAQVGDRHHRR